LYQTFETRSTHNNKHNYNNNNDSLVLSATRKRTVTHTPLDIRSLFCNETCPFPLLPTNTPLPKLDAILPPANASEQQSPSSSSPVASGSPPSPPPTADQKNCPQSVVPALDGRRGDDARCHEQQPIGDGAEKCSGTPKRPAEISWGVVCGLSTTATPPQAREPLMTMTATTRNTRNFLSAAVSSRNRCSLACSDPRRDTPYIRK